MNNKKMVIKVFSMALAVVITVGSMVANNKMSNANEVNNTVESTTSQAKIEENDEIDSFINEIKEKYECQETILSLDDLYAEMDKNVNMTEDEGEALFAKAKREVIREFFYQEMLNAVEKTMEIVNSDDDVEGTKVYVSDGNSRIVKNSTNNYGTTTSIEIKDIDENKVTRSWKIVDSKSETVTKPYGDRKFVVETENTYFFKRLRSEYRMILGYTISDEGITVRFLEDDGTFSNLPGENITVEQQYWSDDNATDIGEAIEATAIYHNRMLGGVVGAFEFPAIIHYQRKLVASVEIVSWDKNGRKMDVEQAFTAYKGNIGFLS